MKKWLDKYEIPEAQNGIEGTMGGLTDKGFNYSPAWGGAWRDGGVLQPPMAGANQTLPMYAMGGNIPGAVGFTYARTKGIPSEGPYGKKTVPSAQKGKKLSYSEWRKKYNLKETPDYNLKRAWELGYNPDKTGHLPTVDNQTGQFLKAKGHPTLQLELDWYNSPEGAEFRKNHDIDSSGRFFKYIPKGQNGQEMQFYQNGLDWTPKNISEYGSEIHKAQVGDDIPWYMRKSSDISQRGNQNLKTEIASQKTKEKKAIASRRITTIGPDTKTDYEREKNRQAYEDRVKYEEEVLGRDFTMPTSLVERNRAKAEQIIHNLVDVPLTLMGTGELVYGVGKFAAKQLPKVGEYLTTQTPLKNTYKINPWAFKPNPEAFYHRSPNIQNIVNQETGMLQGFGQSEAGQAYSELAKPGMGNTLLSDGRVSRLNLRKPANSSLYFSKGVPLDYGRYNPETFNQAGKRIMTGQGYPGPYMVEVEGVPMGASTKGRLPGADPIGLESYAVSRRPISLDEANFYTEDWLRGYKEVPKPKSTFKSEIDWGKWNPETPNYPELINEYNAIEESTKKAGTWMKNPDGSAFQGTPEQFIQQQSSHFKKAFGNSKLVNPDGSPIFLYHGSAKKFDTFDPSKFQLGDAGYSGAGIYTTPSKLTADSYATSSAKFHTGDIEPTVYQLYGQGNRPIKSSDLIKENQGRDLFNFHRNKNWKGELSPYESLKEYDVAIADQLPNVQNIRPMHDAREIVFPTNTQLKSAVGNVGFFDMTNPNIYKAVVPAVIGASALQQSIPKKKKEGGVVKDDNGYWNPENWGKPVEIDSNEITMQGVYEPLIGISNTGDVQYMEPGEDYVFDGESVTEYPVAKNGVNQQDEKTIQHLDQLLNFTNYNKPKAKNGWLDKYN